MRIIVKNGFVNPLFIVVLTKVDHQTIDFY